MIALAAFSFLFTPHMINADDGYRFWDENNTNSLPTVEGSAFGPSYFTAAEYVPAGPYQGRIISATGKNIYLETAVGSGIYVEVANVDTLSEEMDPSFIRVSPDGSRIALGLGWQKDLLVFPAALLNTGTSPDLLTAAGVTAYNVNYYDAA